MAETKYLKCRCEQCGGHIEFPAEGVGLTTACPHCGWQTELTLEAPAPSQAPSSRSLKWMMAGVVILALGLIGAVSAVLMAQRLAKKSRAQPTAILSPVRAVKTNTTTAPAVPSRTKRGESINDFSASEVKIEKTPGSSLVYATGALKNETDKQRFGITVEIDLFDSAGKRVGAATDYKDTIEPRGQWTFRALLLKKETTTARVASVQERF